MPQGIPGLIALMVIVVIIMVVINTAGQMYNLDGIKSKTVGDGQHGTARWATRREIRKTFKIVDFTPRKWRE